MADLHVSKKNISKLFSEMQNRRFVIPDFQRPYKWNIEKCETLWDDIENFTNTDAKKGSDYFLGTIVSYTNDDNNQEIIDGQQRITSFFLLLRSFYKKLEAMPEDDDVKGLKNQLAPCIWDINPISQKVSDMSKIHIESLVATEEDNDTFHKILETGNVNEFATDNYSNNYRFFKERCDQYASTNPLQWKELCVTILQKCIILPIECDTPETALTIFSTLNDRGMPLSDSDIFKAQIYRSKNTSDKRKEFTEIWKELSQVCKQGNLSIDDVFRYYSHVLRGRKQDKSKEVGLRKFYAEDTYQKLKESTLVPEIMTLANFWRYVNKNIIPNDDVSYYISNESRKYLHCLSRYPNDFWKYIVSTFFINNLKSESFDTDFIILLKKLIASLFVKFIHAPTVNAIKDDTYQACINISQGNLFNFRINWNEDLLIQDIDGHHSSRISRALLLLHAYLNRKQVDLIPKTFDIEHIFPKKWQNTNYNGWNQEDAWEYLDRLGNKIVLEKKLNIQAGNGYFGVKKAKYELSKIAVIKELAAISQNDWVKNDIEKRESKFISDLIFFFKEQLSIS
ncbi:DUF262 domain-containing protein [uncultured Algibacter sp.]|uniref:DUF262 domain-containing protein n=1 Tax=uncultured Algibacter sp. TaxID=298659 RepID=UPI002617CB0A|nr:DUF262 domain-containing HNH endonuclease family protein [uncultured Algibacter sp.]